jgi:hypothetical protein
MMKPWAVHLQWFADPAPGDPGPADASGGQAPAEGGQAPSPEPFFTHDRGDGRVETFQSPEELSDHYRRGVYFQDDYTKKTQSLAEERKAFETIRGQHETEKQSLAQLASELKGWKSFFETPRGRSVREQINQAISEGRDGGEVVETLKGEYDPKLQSQDERLARIEQAMERDRVERLRDSAFNSLSTRYPDLDRESVIKEVDRLAAIPGDNTEAFLELVHLASVGKGMGPAVEEKVGEVLDQRRAAVRPMPSVQGKKAAPAEFTSMDEAEAAALKQYEATGKY